MGEVRIALVSHKIWEISMTVSWNQVGIGINISWIWHHYMEITLPRISRKFSSSVRTSQCHLGFVDCCLPPARQLDFFTGQCKLHPPSRWMQWVRGFRPTEKVGDRRRCCDRRLPTDWAVAEDRHQSGPWGRWAMRELHANASSG